MSDTRPAVGPDTAQIQIHFGADALTALTDQQRQALDAMAAAFEATPQTPSQQPGIRCPEVYTGGCEIYMECKGVTLG